MPQAALQAQALLQKSGRKDVHVDAVSTDSLSVSEAPIMHLADDITALITCGSPGSDEDGESAERCCPWQSCDAAGAPGTFWEGSLCLSGSQGNALTC